MAIDLHAHSLASDGSDDPAGLVEQAAVTGIEVLAVTDHNTVEGLEVAIAAGKRLCVQVVPAVRSPANWRAGWCTCLPTETACWRPARLTRSSRCVATASSATCASATGWRH